MPKSDDDPPGDRVQRRMARLLLCVALVACTCEPEEPHRSAHAPQVAPEEPAREGMQTVAVPEPSEQVARTRPVTAQDRAQRAGALPQHERELLRTRSSELSRGRRLGRRGDHEAALTAFLSTLEAAPGDAVVLCEAGFQALQLERWDVAHGLLERGLAQPMQPRTRGACLYNLARVNRGSGGTTAATLWLLERSLVYRENQRVEAWMNELQAELGEAVNEEEYELQSVGPDFEMIVTAGPYDDIQELAEAGACTPLAEPVGTGHGQVRSARLIACADEEQRVELGVLVVERDRGWSLVQRVTESDLTDTYGRLEVREAVASMSWVGGDLRVEIEGGYDESEGEADAYWECERQFAQVAEPDEATADCFDAALEELGPPEHWSRVLMFTLVEGRLVLEAETTSSEE